MKFISRSEEFILLSVWKLKNNAYGVTIRETMKELSGETWAFGAIFVMLDRMAKKGLLKSHMSKPTSLRGGRSKRIFNLTEAGKESLLKVKKVQETVWSDIDGLLEEN